MFEKKNSHLYAIEWNENQHSQFVFGVQKKYGQRKFEQMKHRRARVHNHIHGKYFAEVTNKVINEMCYEVNQTVW